MTADGFYVDRLDEGAFEDRIDPLEVGRRGVVAVVNGERYAVHIEDDELRIRFDGPGYAHMIVKPVVSNVIVVSCVKDEV